MGSITIPTSELLGGINDVLPTVLDPKSSLAGFALEWTHNFGADVNTDESLRFTAYDVRAGATVEWVPGEGEEAEVQGDQEDEVGDGDSITWGGDAAPFRVFVTLADAKEIVKLFKLPAKLWRTPVTLEVSPIGSRLIIERHDSALSERFLSVETYNHVLKELPDVRKIATSNDYAPAESLDALAYPNYRFAALAAARPHGIMRITPNGPHEPTQVTMGARFHAFLYREGAKVTRHSFLRDATGLHVAAEPF